MTMPDERTWALVVARLILRSLSDSPGALNAYVLRQHAINVLRHYPDDGMIQLIAQETVWLEWPWHLGLDADESS